MSDDLRKMIAHLRAVASMRAQTTLQPEGLRALADAAEASLRVPSSHDQVPAADREQKYRRAREVLADAGWLFDDFVNNEMRRVLTSDLADATTREIAYQRARVATEVKTALQGLVDEYEGDLLIRERREQLKESLYGRRD